MRKVKLFCIFILYKLLFYKHTAGASPRPTVEKDEKKGRVTQFLIRILTAYRRYSVCRTDSFDCPSYSVLWI